MTFKFTKPIKEYADEITPELLKTAFEEFEFEVELKEDINKEVKRYLGSNYEVKDTPYFKGYKPQQYFNIK